MYIFQTKILKNKEDKKYKSSYTVNNIPSKVSQTFLHYSEKVKSLHFMKVRLKAFLNTIKDQKLYKII